MRAKDIQVAIINAKNFIIRANMALKKKAENQAKGWDVLSPKHTGALRRTSMELTRALSAMRNNK